MAAVAKVLAVCGATAAGGAACVATGVVDPASVGVGTDDDKPPLERPAEPTATTVSVPTPQHDPGQVDSGAPQKSEVVAEQTPVQQQSRQFNFESAPPPASTSGSSGTSEFGGASGGGSSSGGGGGGSGGGFGIER